MLNNQASQKFDLAALGGVVDQPSQQQGFNLEALGGVVDSNKDSTIGKGVARTAKSLGAGAVGGLADTVTGIINLLSHAINTNKEAFKGMDPKLMAALEGLSNGEYHIPSPQGADIPMIPSLVDAVDKGVDQLTGDYTKPPED